jgi:hypothetical protein
VHVAAHLGPHHASNGVLTKARELRLCLQQHMCYYKYSCFNSCCTLNTSNITIYLIGFANSQLMGDTLIINCLF